MAFNLGQTLASAGTVSSGWRRAEEAQRIARENQLKIEGQNRLNQLRKLALSEPVSNAPDLSANLGEPMEVLDIPVPAEPAPTAGLQTPAAPAAPAAPTAPAAPATPAPKAGLKTPATPVLSAAQQAAAQAATQIASQRPQLSDKAGVGRGGAVQQARQRREIEKEAEQAWSTYEATLPAAERGLRGRPSPASRAREAEKKQFIDAYKAQVFGRPASTATPAQPAAPAAAAPSTPELDLNRLMAAVEQIESSGRGEATPPSPKGAVGPMQTMPGTLTDPGFGVTPARDNSTEELRRVGQDYLQAMLQKYNGNLDHALAAYNWGPTNADKWIAAGADPAKLPKETREYIPKVKAAMGAGEARVAGLQESGAPAATGGSLTTPVERVAAQTRLDPADFYLQRGNEQAVPRDLRIAMEDRQELARMANLYQQAGMGIEFMQIRSKITELDRSMYYLQGMQGIQELEIARDPRRLAVVWSEAAGMPVGVQPRTDGNYNLVMNGRVVREGVNTNQLADMARSSFDKAYRQQKTEQASRLSEKMQESMLKIQEGNASELAKMIRETTVEGIKGNNALALEWAKANYGWDIKGPTADGLTIIRPPNSPPYAFNPSGRELVFDGVKVPANSAVLIGGLPAVSQARLTQVR
jgi:hypothetical protein